MEGIVSIVEMIEMTKGNIKKLEESLKETEKEIARLMQEKDNIVKNLAMYKNILDDLTRIKETEIQVELMGDKQPVKNKNIGIQPKVKVVLIDDKGEFVAEYESQTAAAKDLGLSQNTVSVRMQKTKEEQIKKFGFALIAG